MVFERTDDGDMYFPIHYDVREIEVAKVGDFIKKIVTEYPMQSVCVNLMENGEQTDYGSNQYEYGALKNEMLEPQWYDLEIINVELAVNAYNSWQVWHIFAKQPN